MNNTKRTFNALLGHVFRFSQAEGSDLEYTGNWGPALHPETIISSTWLVVDGSATISNQASTDTTTSATITGPPCESTIVNTVVTSGGQTDQRTVNLKIKSNDKYYMNEDYWRC